MRSLTRALDRSRPEYRAAISSIIRAHVSGLHQRLRMPMIEDLTTHVLRRDPDPSLFLTRSRSLQIASIVLHLRHSIPDLQASIAAMDAQFRADTVLYDSLTSAADRRAFLERFIRESSADPRSIRGDLKALDRHFGFDCLRERHAHQKHRLSAACEVALDFIAGALRALTRDSSVRDAAAQQIIQRSDLPDFLLGCLEGERWQSRLAAIDAVLSLPPLARQSISMAKLLACVTNPDEHPWVRGQALRVAWCVEPRWAESITRGLLLDREDPPAPRDFLTRRQVVLALAEPRDEAFSIVEELVRVGDPSEHVRLSVAELVTPWASGMPRALALLAHVAATDTSVTVRTDAARRLVDTLGGAMVAGEDQLILAVARIIADLLTTERSSLPIEATCEALVRLALDTKGPLSDGTVTSLRPIREALAELSRRDETPGPLLEVAAAGRAALEMACDPRSTHLRTVFDTMLATIAPPGRATAKSAALAPDERDPMAMGRVLATLSRRDFGIDCELQKHKLVLYRGDRKRRRLWRLLHELRHPAPNKRQGHRHTTGRVFRGALRAPPGRLDEVTPTVVPGERVHRDAENGWGRHLPLVDDVLDTPAKNGREVRIFSSHGVTTIRSNGTRWQRWWRKFRLSLHYGTLSSARLKALDADDEFDRGQYARLLREEYGIELDIEPYSTAGEPHPLPARVRQLFRADAQKSAGVLAPLPLGIPWPSDAWGVHLHYFFSMFGNSQEALAAFLTGVFAVAFTASHQRLRAIARARARIPLCIGGWGTRGKSGTERLKAGMFHGLGYEVFCKTTGCEAMFIHAMPDSMASETFVFRPYGKATIWEQRNLLELGADLGCQVFLWECMALNPRYVEILQKSWMRDDYSTLTNAYPDHEDIQGPTGADVADAISRFIPHQGTLITTEINFLPLFREVCRQRDTNLVALDEHRGELLGKDLLALFPYDEHPRNIALVAELGRQLGIDPALAVVTMADHVVPDLGVLKIYPEASVYGRTVRFINGCSANERTGFLTSWRRTGCADLDADSDPARMIVTVVNNRDDRISRSEVFARILVEDISADRHILIGTNIRGLLQFIHQALGEFLETIVVVRTNDVAGEQERQRSVDRLERLRRRLRVPPGYWEPMELRLRLYAGASGHVLRDAVPLREAWERLGADPDLNPDAIRSQVRSAFDRLWSTCLIPTPAHQESQPDDPSCSLDEAISSFVDQCVRQLVFIRLRRRLDKVMAESSNEARDDFTRAVRTAYQALFLASVIPIEDPTTKGDVIIERCARSVPPGVSLSIMGTQNIKGTGLDFVYRWIALQKMTDAIERAGSGDRSTRDAALSAIETFEDHGTTDLAALARFVRTYSPQTEEERAACDRIRRKIERLRTSRGTTTQKTWWRRGAKLALDWLEGWIDLADSVVRYHQSQRIMKDLVARRISHERATVLMREIYAREKGGWLGKRLLG